MEIIIIIVVVYILENVLAISRKSPKHAISGRVGSMCSLKNSIAIVLKSNNSSVTLYGFTSFGVTLM